MEKVLEFHGHWDVGRTGSAFKIKVDLYYRK